MSIASQELIKAWLLFPVVFVAASIFLGMALFRISHLDLKNPLVLPAGFVVMVVAGQITTLSSQIAPRTPIIFLVCTLLCAIYFWPQFVFWLKHNLTALVLGFTVFYIHGLPILMSRTPTFAGWIKLDDGSTWLALTDQMLSAGHDTSGLAPSTFEALTQIQLSPISGDLPYPSGSFVPLGVFSKLLAIDPAWILQPYMAAAALVLGVTFFAILQPIKISNWSKRVAAIVAPTSALFLGYEMWGGIKELLLVPLIVFVTAMIPEVLEHRNEPRCIIPFALACSAYVLIFSISGLVWLFMPILVLVIQLTSETKKIPWRHALGFLGIFVVASLAVILPASKHLKAVLALGTFAKSSSDIGNLLGPLKFAQIFGVWLTGDFRYPSHSPFLSMVLVILSGSLFVFGCYFLLTSGHSYIALLGIWVILVSVFALQGNAWISGKTLAMASPIVLIIAFCGIGSLANQFSIETGVIAVVLSGGVLASYVYTYHEVWLAPYAQLKELEVIGENTSYKSPALMTEYSPYGSRHFLRKLDTESAGELRRHLIPLRTGKGLEKGVFADVDEFALDSIESYDTLVLRTAANSSRPPGNYDLKFKGVYYEVWQKNAGIKIPIAHYPLGSLDEYVTDSKCLAVESTISKQLEGNDIVVSFSRYFLKLPLVATENKSGVAGKESAFESKFDVSNTGKFDLWVAGTFKGRASVFIDDIPVAVASHVLNQSGNMTKIGDLQLKSGSHVLKVLRDSPWWQPGSGGLAYQMGPFYLSDQSENSVVTVQPNNIKVMCLKPVDWVELFAR